SRARERLLAGAGLTAAQYLRAVRWRLALKERALAAFADIDVAVTASSMDPACRIDDVEALARNYWRQARMPFNVTGQPAIVIPAGFARGGLPLSLQIVGHPFCETMCYRVAVAYERAMAWVAQHPSLP
ncbi:MAG TPA: amidase family protein, partial [Stellaceae bacterium]|nr:amidase family protein [Stellaceae bacterium]